MLDLEHSGWVAGSFVCIVGGGFLFNTRLPQLSHGPDASDHQNGHLAFIDCSTEGMEKRTEHVAHCREVP